MKMEEMSTNFRRRRRRAALIVVLAGVAALSIQQLVAPRLWDVLAGPHDAGAGAGREGARRSLSSSLAEEEADLELEDRWNGILVSKVDALFGSDDEEILAVPDEDSPIGGGRATPASEAGGRERRAARRERRDREREANDASHAQLVDAGQPLPPYTIEDAIESSKVYNRNFALLAYDPAVDAFFMLYSKRHFWVSGCDKLLKSFKFMAYLLRKVFPERFQGKTSKELIIPFSSGDYLGVKASSITNFHHGSTGTPPGAAPILHFGSLFRNPHIFPNIIDMPMPVLEHLDCFRTWAGHGVVSKSFSDKLLFGEKIGLTWEDLIPQVVWRGTDFNYLNQVLGNLFVKPTFQESRISWPFSQPINDQKAKKIGGVSTVRAAMKKRRLAQVQRRMPERAEHYERVLARFTKAAAVESLRGEYARLLPRWQAVILTAEAEADAEPGGLPWANMKFSNYIQSGSKTDTVGSDEYKEWEDIGMATGTYMSTRTLSEYKYQIDLGGGGGTTWSGTIEKLSMPGLLFHHLTPTKDYIHDWMTPWVHYVPVASDLRDLKQKFDWAESHPVEAKKIADEGTNLMRYLASPEGFEQMFQQDLVEPLRRVIEAYQPTSTMTWRSKIQEIEGDRMLFPVMKCVGRFVNTCEQLLGNNHLRKEFTRKTTRHLPAGV